MPIPTPNKGEDKNKYMGRCMTFMTNENNGKPDKQKRSRQQMVAICFNQWDQHSKASAAKDFGKGPALKVNKSKAAMSTSSWGSVDKTALRNRILNASNYSSLVHDAYLLVESGWENSPSSALKYPVMQISNGTLVYNRGGLEAALSRAVAQGETGVVSKVHGLYRKLGLETKKTK